MHADFTTLVICTVVFIVLVAVQLISDRRA
jgi:hypothetical protein